MTEDHKIAKILSSWSSSESIALINLSPFDTQARDKIIKIQKLLFTTCKLLETTLHNVSHRVLDMLTTYLSLRYSLLEEDNPTGPAIKRLEGSALKADCSVANLLGWPTHLASIQAASSQIMKRENRI